MITGILLAAGRGERFGGDKLLATLPDGHLVAEAAARAMVAALPGVIAVVRPRSEALEEILRTAGCETIVCPAAREGMGASLACGIRASRDADGWIIALADMPWIRTGTIARVAAGLAEGSRIVAPVHQGQRGHPVGFAAAFGEDLACLSGGRGADGIVRANRQCLDLFETDDGGILRDVDVPRDLAGE